MKTLLTIIFFFTTLISFSQNSKDTLINGVKYNHVKKYDNGKVMEAGNYDKKNRLNGEWISFGNGDESASGQYKNDKKVGQWWYHKHEIIWYNKKGKVIKKGSGCKDCPAF